MDVSKLPEQFAFIDSVQITEYAKDETKYFYHAIIFLKDKSQLHVKEYYDFGLSKHNYSFHWQKLNGNLIMRWDNTPHHRHIKSFPFHAHTANSITESDEMFIEDVLRIISKSFSSKREK